MLITISGMVGSGKGTVAALLGKRLRMPVYSIGDIRRAVAKKYGMTLEQYNRYGETHPATDHEPDNWAAREAKKTGRGVYDGRVMFHFIPQSVKVFLDCDERVGAQRISRDTSEKRKSEADLTEEKKALAALRRRIASDKRRYWKFYKLDVFDMRNYDLVVDTTNITPEQTMKKIMEYLANPNKDII